MTAMTAMQSKKIARLSYSSPYSTITQTQMTHMTRNNATTGDVGISLFYVEFLTFFHGTKNGLVYDIFPWDGGSK